MSKWLIGDVVQVDPAHDSRFGGCFMIVTEPKSWGAQGCVRVPGGGDACYRSPSSALTLIGRAVFVPPAVAREEESPADERDGRGSPASEQGA